MAQYVTEDYYILRIYRRSNSDQDGMLGTLEDVSSGTNWPFKNDEELRRLLGKLVHPGTGQSMVRRRDDG